MGLLLAFSPFLAFLAGEHLLGVVPALCAGCAVAVALVVRGAHETRVLEAGTALLFGALAACAAFVPGIAWSVGLVRLVVDGGLMLLVLRPAWPVLIPVAISAAALCAAMKFTQWWPARAAQRA